MFFFVKVIVTALLVALVSEISKRSSFFAAVLVSLPLTSLLSFIWIYLESKDLQKISSLSTNVLLMILPSLVLFLVLPLFIKWGLNFWLSLSLSCALTAVTYTAYVKVLARCGVML